jgi:CBS domain containing-hemolysin-like protein
MNELVIWLGMGFCLTQSAIFSGMNLAVFSLSRLRLEAAAEADHDARRVLGLRRNANFTLSSILWGNVAINVLLALLANSVLAGVSAFLFSTVVITIVGEIMPQAYFSRHALRIASRLAPLLRLYQVFLWPVAWPSGKLLDIWIGPEGIPWYRERELRHVLQQHATMTTARSARSRQLVPSISFTSTTSLSDRKANRSIPGAYSSFPFVRSYRSSRLGCAARTRTFFETSTGRAGNGLSLWMNRTSPGS